MRDDSIRRNSASPSKLPSYPSRRPKGMENAHATLRHTSRHASTCSLHCSQFSSLFSFLSSATSIAVSSANGLSLHDEYERVGAVKRNRDPSQSVTFERFAFSPVRRQRATKITRKKIKARSKFATSSLIKRKRPSDNCPTAVIWTRCRVRTRSRNEIRTARARGSSRQETWRVRNFVRGETSGLPPICIHIRELRYPS